MNERNIICIDLKSFFASCECIDKKLDPFTTPLIVADPSRGGGAITLAVTPYLKSLGVPSRGRVYEIPKNLNYIIAKPRMELYVKKSKEIINIFLDFVDINDLHIYSIDESFLDITDYLKLYKKTDIELAELIMNTIKEKTGLTSTCGIGPNMLLAKVALDIESKHNPTNIAKWTYNDVKSKLWDITPLTKMWGIGEKTMKKLNNLGIKKIGDINKYPCSFYKKRFGILGEELYMHANGIDNSNIKEKKETLDKSYSLSQILFKDYTVLNTPLIIREMSSTLAKRLRKNNKTCQVISLGIGYSKTIGKFFHHRKKINSPTNSEEKIYEICIHIFNNYVEDLPIRKISISLGDLKENSFIQLNMFENINKNEKTNKLNITLDEITNKFGSNSILKASSLMDYSTIKKRNNTLGGHNRN